MRPDKQAQTTSLSNSSRLFPVGTNYSDHHFPVLRDSALVPTCCLRTHWIPVCVRGSCIWDVCGSFVFFSSTNKHLERRKSLLPMNEYSTGFSHKASSDDYHVNTETLLERTGLRGVPVASVPQPIRQPNIPTVVFSLLIYLLLSSCNHSVPAAASQSTSHRIFLSLNKNFFLFKEALTYARIKLDTM